MQILFRSLGCYKRPCEIGACDLPAVVKFEDGTVNTSPQGLPIPGILYVCTVHDSITEQFCSTEGDLVLTVSPAPHRVLVQRERGT